MARSAIRLNFGVYMTLLLRGGSSNFRLHPSHKNKNMMFKVAQVGRKVLWCTNVDY